MRKLLIASLFGFSTLATAAPQPVVDVDALRQLAEIREILASNQQKVYSCTDGEKWYTVGLQIKRDSQEYKCVLVNNHAEWTMSPRYVK